MITKTRTTLSLTAVGALAAGLVGTTTTAAFAQTSTTSHDAPRCAHGQLPDSVMGSPGLKPGSATGVYLWHGSDGYSLRATHPGKARVVFTGTLVASRSFSDIAKVALEKSDVVHLSANHRTLTFRFTNYGGIDGLNFAADCSATMKVAVRINGKPAGPESIMLGKHRTHPTSNPFTIERHAETAAAPTGSTHAAPSAGTSAAVSPATSTPPPAASS